ncbi:plakophilin-3-like [Arapaima gigas]
MRFCQLLHSLPKNVTVPVICAAPPSAPLHTHLPPKPVKWDLAGRVWAPADKTRPTCGSHQTESRRETHTCRTHLSSHRISQPASMPESSVSSYALPSGVQLDRGTLGSDAGARNRRVHQQVQMRLAQKGSATQQVNGSADYGISPTMKFSTYSPAFSSRSHTLMGSHTIAAPRISQFTSNSLVDMGSWGGGSNSVGRFNTGTLPQVTLQQTAKTQQRMSGYMEQNLVGNGSASERNVTLQRHSVYGDGFSSHVGTLGSTNKGFPGISGARGEAELSQKYSFKGPAHRTLTRITRVSRPISMQGQQMSDISQVAILAGGNSLHRSSSVKSTASLAKGFDITDSQIEFVGNMGKFGGINQLDMKTAVMQLSSGDPDLQIQGAAFIQHECYHKAEAKTQVGQLKGIPALVQLFNNESQEVQLYATAAMRNVIYENMENKTLLLQADGILHLMEALKETNDELRKNITGILWNLSSKDNLKEKLAQDVLPHLTEKILVPLTGDGDSEAIQQSLSEAEIFCNTTGCLRNLSSMNEKTRQKMRNTRGLVDSLTAYIQNSIRDGKVEDKGTENSMCILRNLSYQLYSELPHSTLLKLERPSREQEGGRNDAIGCFSVQGAKANDKLNQDLLTFSEVTKQPRGQEWLWHPQVVRLYTRMLESCEGNVTTRDAATGALSNITAGDHRWASVLSRVALDHERILPVLLDKLRSSNDQELRSVTGLIRNLTRHAQDKDNLAKQVVNLLVSRLPSDGHQKELPSEVVVNICGALNNLVTASSNSAQEITAHNGLQKLVAIKNCLDNSPGQLKAAKAAATVLSNMFQYKKLHKEYKQKGFMRRDFTDVPV